MEQTLVQRGHQSYPFYMRVENKRSRNFFSAGKIVVLTLCAFVQSSAHASVAGHRLSLGAGIIQLRDSQNTHFALSGEYEYRLNPHFGLGFSGNYIFTSPDLFFLAAPELFFHPLEGEWYVAAAPLLQGGGGMDQCYGVRVATRLPLNLGVISLIPEVSIDFIDGGRNIFYGIGIGI